MAFSKRPFPKLKTKRLNLRPLEKRDTKEILFLRSDKEVNQFIKRSPPQNIDDAKKFIAKIQTEFVEERNIYWVISFIEDTSMLGSICLWNFSSDHKTGEVGYDLHPDYQNQGFMHEAMQAVLKFGFEELQLDHITAFTHHSNESSKKLLKKNGFVILYGEKDAGNKNNIILSLSRHQALKI